MSLHYPCVKNDAAVGEWRSPNQCWLERARRISVRSTVGSRVVLGHPRRAEGSTVYDVDDNAYLDFGKSVGTNNFGFGNSLQSIRRARDEVSGLPSFHSHGIFNAYGIIAQELLANRTPLNNDSLQKKVYVANSGTEANETVMKMLFHNRPERPYLISFEGAFHGRTLGPLSLIDRRKPIRIRGYPLPIGSPTVDNHRFDVITLPFPDASLMDPVGMIKEELCKFSRETLKRCNGIFIECVQGEGGINPAAKYALQFLVDELRKHDVQVVADEIQSGMGRTGMLWAYLHYGIRPDFVTMGKSLCGGFPAGAAVTTARWDFSEDGAQGSTFGAELDRAAAILAAFEILDREKLCERALSIGRVLNRELHRIAESTPLIRRVRGLGAMYGVEFTSSIVRDTVQQHSEELGLLLEGAGIPELNPTLRFMPPLIVSDDDLMLGLSIFQRVIHETYPHFIQR